MVERELPGAGSLSESEINDISRTSNQVRTPDVGWDHGYVTDDKIYCVHLAPDADRIRAHAEQDALPANSVSEVRRTIDPTTVGR